MIRKLFFFIFALSLGLTKAQEEVQDLINIPGPIEFNGTEFYRTWSKQQSKTLTVQQYLPNDEKIEDFNQLLNFSYFNKDIDIELAVRQKVESIQKKAETDKFAKINVSESPDGKEYIVDYTISAEPPTATPYIEYNIYRFKKYDAEPKPLLIFSFAKRMYGDLKSSSKSLMKQRDQLLTAAIEYKIPEIKIANSEPVPVKK